MLIQVNPHKIVLIKTNDVNSGEYNVNECTFEFSQEFDNLTCIAVFSLCDGTTRNITILNNRCIIPTEVLQQTGQVKIGVYGYSVQDDELVLRYSPTPQIFVVTEGSYKEGTEPVAPTPTDWEILVQQVSDNSRDISNIQEEIGDINADIVNINAAIDDLDDKKANINDLSALAFSGSYNDLINKPNLSVYATKTDLSDEATLRENADVALQEQIDAISVSSDVVDVVGTYQELLDYDTTHLKDNDIVKVLNDSTHNDALSYYRWDKEPQTWSYIGSEGPFYTKTETQELLNGKVDNSTLDNYVKNTDYATGGKAGVVKIAYSEGSDVNSVGYLRGIARTYADYPNLNNTYIISKGTLENVITGKDLTTKAYVDGLVGDLETILTTLDIGSGVNGN